MSAPSQPEQAPQPHAALHRWAASAALLFGAALGLGAFTFAYAEGSAYMTNDPAACANCHVMQSYYDGWLHASHHTVATCNDCHTPHDFAGKWLTKASNGYHHSVAFTFGGFHEPIQITPPNHRIVEDACRYCHADVVHQIDDGAGREPLSCVRCHAAVGHVR